MKDNLDVFHPKLESFCVMVMLMTKAHLIMMKKQLGADKAHYYPLVTNKAVGVFLKVSQGHARVYLD